MMSNNNNMNLMNNMYQINQLVNMNNQMFNQIYNNNQFNQNNNFQMPNLMNNNNIFNLYQRIFELENIIKQKDLEIENLKQKLNNNEFSNWINLPCFKKVNLKFKIISSENPNKVIELEERFYNNEKFDQVKELIENKLNMNLNNYYFLHNKLLISNEEKVFCYPSNSIIIIKEKIDEKEFYDSYEKHGENWDLKFVFNNQGKNIEFTEKCNCKEKFIKIEIRIAKKLNKDLKDLKFIFNGLQIIHNCSPSENLLNQESKIFIIETIKYNSDQNDQNTQKSINIIDTNIIFNIIIKSLSGCIYNIAAHYKWPIKLILLYSALMLLDQEKLLNFLDGKKNYFFFYLNSIGFKDNRVVGQIFEGNPNPVIFIKN